MITRERAMVAVLALDRAVQDCPRVLIGSAAARQVVASLVASEGFNANQPHACVETKNTGFFD